MKKLYTFKEVKKEKVLTKKSTENEKGEKVTVEKEEEREVSHEFFMRKPNRRLYDDADLYYAVKLSEGIKAGLLTKALLEKRYDNDGGVLSNTEIENYGQMYVDFYNKQQEIMQIDPDNEPSEDQQKKLDELKGVIDSTREALTNFEMGQQALYDQTAEVRSRNKTILWWVLFASYKINKEGEEEPFFRGDTADAKLEHYDRLIEDEDDFTDSVIRKFTYLISFWFVSKVDSEEELSKMITKQGMGENLDMLDDYVDENSGSETEPEPKEEPEPEEEPKEKPEEEPKPEGEPEPKEEPEEEPKEEPKEEPEEEPEEESPEGSDEQKSE